MRQRVEVTSDLTDGPVQREDLVDPKANLSIEIVTMSTAAISSPTRRRFRRRRRLRSQGRQDRDALCCDVARS